MIKKIFTVSIVSLFIVSCFFPQSLSFMADPGEIYTGRISISYRNVTVYAPAVAKTNEGYIGVISTITVTVQSNGSGRVFVDTLPLTQIDMQGSARLAVKVASALVKSDENCSVDPSGYDFFFVVRTSAPIIGGPSAGAVMTVATIAALENWSVDNHTVMTGMINPDGSIGPVGGILQKIDAAYSVGATRFLIPKGQGTYTEMVTETRVINGWKQIITHPVTRNVSDYAMEKYGINVVEVADINDALLYTTGRCFEMTESNSQITTEDYIDSMKPLASMLLDEAKNLFNNASELFNNSHIPNRFPFYYRNQITDILNEANSTLKEAEKWYKQELYYSSTSKSFQSLIDSRFVSYACRYFSSDDEQEYLQNLIDEATSLYNNKSEEAKNEEINGMISLQCVGAAQKRASEANTYLSEARNSYNRNDYLNALYKIAFAVERSKSIGWWLRISSYFNDTGEINNTMLTNLAEEYIEDAEQAAVYSNVILQEIGKASNYLNEAEESLNSAQKDKEQGYPAAALFEALEALLKANLALELIDGTTNDKIERAQESASNSISESRKQGIEPVLAVSYYEYAQTLKNESSLDSALVYYKYSDLIAGALTFTTAPNSRSSRYVGIPEIKTPTPQHILLIYPTYLTILLIILGGIAGLGLGLIICGISSKHKEKKYFYKKWMPRSIHDYYKKQQK